MKRILMALLGFTLSLALNAQIKDWFNEISETQINPNYNSGINTMEGYVSAFIKTYGVDEYHKLVDAIEAGTLDKYTDHLRDLGAKGFVEEADCIKGMMWGINGSKLYFVSNGKLYIITYDPKEGPDNYESLYLFRRDDDGWKPASNLIRKDEYKEGQSMKKFDSRTTLWGKTNTHFMLENLYYGSVNKISSGSVFVTFGTEIWNPRESYSNYNSILVLVPHDVGTYTATVFEPSDLKGKVVNNITSYYNTWGSKKDNYNVVWHKSVEPAVFPVLFGTRNTEYKESENGSGLTIRYIDGTVDNPIDAGEISFVIDDEGRVFYGIPGTNLSLIEK